MKHWERNNILTDGHQHAWIIDTATPAKHS